jgi:hypothetical protein
VAFASAAREESGLSCASFSLHPSRRLRCIAPPASGCFSQRTAACKENEEIPRDSNDNNGTALALNNAVIINDYAALDSASAPCPQPMPLAQMNPAQIVFYFLST